jgi:oxygen-dependent protoporphyrinogen oxidase
VSGIPKVKKGSSASFKGGISALPAAIADSLGSKVILGSEAQSIVHDSSSSLFTTTLTTPSGEVKIESKSVVLAVPPSAAASLLSPMSSKAGESIGKITAPAVHAVSISYPSSAFRENSGCYDEDGGVRGFGVLIPRSEGMGTLGFQFISSLFPERAPKGQTVLLAYYGGAQNPQAASLSADEVVERVHRDAQKILLKNGADAPRVLSVKLWGEGIPQYNTGHKDLIREAVGELPDGLILAGNIDGGVSIGDCVARSRQVASQALKLLGK